MKELFESYYKKAEELMNKMTLEQKIAQMFLARYPQGYVNEEIVSENPGGYILFGRDFDFTQLTSKYVVEVLFLCRCAAGTALHQI